MTGLELLELQFGRKASVPGKLWQKRTVIVQTAPCFGRRGEVAEQILPRVFSHPWFTVLRERPNEAAVTCVRVLTPACL